MVFTVLKRIKDSKDPTLKKIQKLGAELRCRVIDFGETVVATAIHVQRVFVMDPEGFAMRDGEQGDAHLAADSVHGS